MSLRLDGRNPLAYMGVKPVTPPALIVQYRQPTTNDIQNFSLGTLWVIPNQNSGPTEEVWVLVDKAENIATWAKVFPQAAPVGGVVTLTGGDGGGAVGPTVGGNIDIYGTTGNITVIGNPGTNRLTINVGGEIPTTFEADAAQTATPALGIIKILGGADGNIVTTASGNTVTLNNTLTVTTDDASTAGFINGAMEILGGACTTTSGDSTTAVTVGLDDDAGNGKIPIGRTTGTTIFANITSADSSVTITNGANSIDLSGTGFPSLSSFFAYVDGDLAAFFSAPATPTVIPFDTTLFNNGSDYDTTTYTWTCPATGLYYFTSNVLIGCGLTNFSFAKNLEFTSSGSPMCYCNYPPANTNGVGAALSPFVGLSHGIFVPMTLGATLQVKVSVSDETDLSIIGYDVGSDSQYTWFAGYRVA